MVENRVVPLSTKLRYASETILVYMVYYLFAILPYKTASNIGEKLGDAAYKVLKSSNRVALKNLEVVFPEKTLEEKQAIIKGMWRNIGRIAAEYPHLTEIWKDAELQGGEYLDEIKNSGDAAILFSAHLGNWELASHSAHSKGMPIKLVYRKPNNYWIDGLLNKARGRGSEQTIAKGRQGAREIVTTIKEKGVLGILMDQKLNEGVAVPFFGKEAMTADATASFALKFNCPLYPSQVIRKKGTDFIVRIYPKLDIKNTGNKDKDIYNILLEINKNIEGWIKENPEQWLWIHKRWDKPFYKN